MTSEQCVRALKMWGVSIHSVSTEGQVQCHCPFHDDSQPSMTVNSGQELWHCFAGCGGGSLESLATKLDKEYVVTIPEDLHIDLSIVVDQQDKHFNIGQYIPAGESGEAIDYTMSRNVSAAIVKRLDWRWDVDENRMVYPVRSQRGVIVGILFQRPGGKCISPDFVKSMWLYGLYESSELSGPIVLVEGSIDAAVVMDAGYRSVALMGSSPSDAQMLQLGGEEVVLFFDHDDAGYSCTKKAAEMLYSLSIDFRVVEYTRRELGSDPADYSVGMIGDLVHSAENFPMTLDKSL